MISVLGIETSCDESSAAVVRYEPAEQGPGFAQVVGIATFSQIEIHRPYGGVVPEIASRNHLETLNPMIREALRLAGLKPTDLDGISVTNRPGLVGALLVGVSAAKALAYASKKPLVAVHHLEGHIASLFLDRSPADAAPSLPLLVAVVSGGHTQLYVLKENPSQWSQTFLKDSLVGRSRDDAAGEAFDKTAKLMGFPYPGGVWIDRTSKGGDPKAFSFPVALPQKDTFDFSFSGLKTAVSLVIAELKKSNRLDREISNLCASVQEAIVENLWRKIALAISRFNCRSLAIVGGVAANSRLREKLSSDCPVPVFFPKHEYCTDNGAMIAAAGAFRLARGQSLSLDQLLSLNAIPYPEF